MVGSEKVEKVIRSPNKLPSGWQKPTLAEVAEIIMGQSPSSEYYNSDGEGLPFFQGKAEFGELYPEPVKWCSQPNKVAQKGDVLMSVRAPVGPTNLAITECCIGRGLAAIRPRDGVPSRYILYYLRSIESGIDALGTGTTFKAISGGILRSIPIPIAPASQQDRIVAEIEKQFSRLDEAVANLKRIKANLKRYKAAVLKAAVKGKLTEEWRKQHPDVEPASKLLERILAGRSAKLGKRKEGFLSAEGDPPAESPDSWVTCSIDQIAECLDAKRVPVNKAERAKRGGNIPYYGANGQVGVIDDYIFDEALVLVVEDETFTGRTQAFSYLIRGKSWVNNHAHVLRPTFAVNVKYLNHALAHRGGSGWLDSVEHSLSGAWRIADYAAVCRVVRLLQYTWSGVWPSSA